MIKKLRFKFIFATLAALLIVLVIILGAVNIVNYNKVVGDIDDILYVLEYNGGSFDGKKDGKEGKEGKEDFPGGKPDGIPEDMLDSPGSPRPEDMAGAFPEDGEFEFDSEGWRHRGIDISDETPYETRYFVVNYDLEGSFSSADLGRIASVDEEEALEYAAKAYTSSGSKGFIDNYRYLVTENTECTRIIFLDATSRMASTRSFLLISIIIAAAGWLIMAVIVVILSGRIIKPFADNYEKQRRFITDAGHELKTPLAIISADVEVLEMDMEEENEWLDDIKGQTKRLTELTNELVMLSKMEEAPDKAQWVEFSLSDVTEETVNPFRSRAIAEGKTLAMNITPMITMNGQEKAIRQLISILMDNACKYSLPESEIKVTLRASGKNAVLEVYNKCAPVTKEQLSHMFDRFYRTDESRNSSTGGYGIGLAIARAVTDGHKGKIQASTDDGNSISITATLPL